MVITFFFSIRNNEIYSENKEYRHDLEDANERLLLKKFLQQQFSKSLEDLETIAALMTVGGG